MCAVIVGTIFVLTFASSVCLVLSNLPCKFAKSLPFPFARFANPAAAVIVPHARAPTQLLTYLVVLFCACKWGDDHNIKSAYTHDNPTTTTTTWCLLEALLSTHYFSLFLIFSFIHLKSAVLHRCSCSPFQRRRFFGR